MAIDKITPNRLDKSSDYKLIPKTSMVDALNILITENDGADSNSKSGNLGVLKNIKGNQEVLFFSDDDRIPDGEAKIIGSVTDTKLKIIYFFVWHENPADQGVWAYDPLGKLPVDNNTSGTYTQRIRKIHKSDLYNFPEHGFVKGDIIYTSQTRLSAGNIRPGTEKDFEKDTILYFTDNTNEPRKLNVYMAMLGEDSAYGLDDRIDFITACPKTPLEPITFVFVSDPSKTNSNFKSGPGFQFAYQFIYKDGVESAISPYSDIAFSPGLINQGTLESVNHILHNKCELTIPYGGEEIEEIKILARQFNNPELVILEQVPNNSSQGDNWNFSTRKYAFYNDRIVKGVSTNEFNKQYDNLPRKAQAQTAVDNRLMYGNYLEGFDNIRTQCSATVNFESRPTEFVDLTLKLIPAVSEQQYAYAAAYGPGSLNYNPNGTNAFQQDGARNKSSGYIIDAEDIPSDIPANSVLNISVSVAPQGNFNVYQATRSYHQSRHRGAFLGVDEHKIDYSVDAEEGFWDGGEWGGEAGEWPAGGSGENSMYGHQGITRSGAKWIKDTMDGAPQVKLADGHNHAWGIPYSGNNLGVSGNDGEGFSQYDTPAAPKWKTKLGPNAGNEGIAVTYGTSAGNPLIIKGGQSITFQCSFKVNQAINGIGKAAITTTVAQALCGRPLTWGSGQAFTILDSNVNPEININLDITQGMKIYEDNPFAKLVCGAVKQEPINSDDDSSYSRYKAPIGHFIMNKAKVKFYLEKDESFGMIDNDYEMIRLGIAQIRDVETVTVAKKKFPGSPWFCFTKDWFESGDLNLGTGSLQMGYNGDVCIQTWDQLGSEGEIVDSPLINPENGTLDDWDYNYDKEATTQPYSVEIEESESEYNSPDQPEISISGNSASVLPCQVAGLETVFMPTMNNASLAAGSPNGTGGATVDAIYQPLLENLQQKQEMFFLGYLDFNEYNVGQYHFNEFFGFNKDYIQNALGGYEIFPFSLLDGESGPGGTLAHNLYNGWQAIPDIGSSHRFVKTITNSYFNNPNNDTGHKWEEDHYDAMWIHRSVVLGGPEFTGTINTRMIPTRDAHLLLYSEFARQSNSFQEPDGAYESDPSYSNYHMPHGPANCTGPNRTYLYYMQGSWDDGTDQPNDELTDTGSISLFPYSHRFGLEFAFDFIDATNNSPAENGGWPFVIDFETKGPHIEIIESSTVFDQQSGQGGGGGDRTFKSSANHDFGIVYYDQRGRHGFVNHLKTVYVPGYSQVERGASLFGKSTITLNLEHEPPIWAHNYKIVYTKNTSVQNFMQYSAGGAWKAKDTTSNVENTKIYVSLNYLQHCSLSYVKDWGARDPEGGLNMFKFIPGANQKCKVISAYTDNDNRIFPFNYEFDIVDMVILGLDDNPLTDTPEEEPWLMGEFAVLRNNKEAVGFSFASVADETHRWNNNCIIELLTPQKGIEADERFYYEIGDTYSIDNPETSSRSHNTTQILLDKGDVWWRKVPVNWKPFEEGDFQNLITFEEGNSYQQSEDFSSYASNFVPYYLESETANDLFKADATLIGRPNIIVEDAVETIRESSITYSGRSNPNSRKINYSSFNLTLSNFKELQEEFGDINYMCNIEGDVFVIQSDRCTLVPASKTLFSSVSGVDTVAASKSPLGQERVYAGRAGCDNNPESAIQVGTYVYFAHKNLGKVFRFNPAKGVQEISNQGMASYFRELFKDALQSSMDPNYNDIRVVGGFDPVNDEYLLTVLNPETYGQTTSGGGYGGGDGGTGGSNDEPDSDFEEPLNPGVTTTIDNLEQQIWDILDGIINTEDDDGKPVFDKEELPGKLKDFYDNPPTAGVLDYKLHLDTDGDGIFNASEVVSSSVIKSVFDDSVSQYAQQAFEAFESDFLQPLFDAIDDPDVPSDIVSIVNYINNLESSSSEGEAVGGDFLSHINNIVNPIHNLQVALDVNRQSFIPKPYSETMLGANDSESFMNVFGEFGQFPLENILKNAQDVSLALRLLQNELGGAEAHGLQAVGDPIYSGTEVFDANVLDGIEDFEIGADFFPKFKENLETIMNASISSNTGNNILGVAQEFIANNYLEALRNNSISTMTVADVQSGLVPQSIVDYLNDQFGLSLTVEVLQENYPELVTQIEGNLIVSLGADPSLLTGYEGGQGLIDSIINNHLLDNPSLSGDLQQFMINNSIVTQGDLLTFIIDLQNNQGGGDGQYNSLQEALQVEGINLDQLKSLTEQILDIQVEGPSLSQYYADLNNDQTISTADLLVFLGGFGQTFTVNSDQTYNDLNLN